MNYDEIFAALSARAIAGMMYHDQMARYYGFLGMDGYRLMHEYHYAGETIGHRDINNYYLNHYCKLIPERHVQDPAMIPQTWMPHTRGEVDMSTKRKAVQTGASEWVEWEKETKAMFEKAAKDLLEHGEMASYSMVMGYVEKVDHELARARKEMLTLEAVGYDLPFIMDRQEMLKKKYEHKLDKIEW